jgi:glutamate formiminotransferase
VLECVVNVSEGRDERVLERLTTAAGSDLLDLHTDPDHHRTVMTLVGEDAPRRLAAAAVACIDLGDHDGVHPRLGAVDVVPFVPLAGSVMADALAARDGFATWLGGTLDVPVFLYGPERTLPEVRRGAFTELRPDTGPPTPHPTAGACCAGARPLLVAYNVWLTGSSVAQARAVAAAIRRPELRALGLAVGTGVQVSMNLVAPDRLGPDAAYDLVVARLAGTEGTIERAELVGLVPAAVLDAVAPERWDELDLAPDRTIEARLARAG